MCAFSKNRVEHRRQIARVGVDDLQHLCGRSLLVQCLALLGEQPCVLDGDDCLISEGADKFDLPVGERLHPLPPQTNDPDRRSVAQERYSQQRVDGADTCVFLRLVKRIGQGIKNMNWAAFDRHAADERTDAATEFSPRAQCVHIPATGNVRQPIGIPHPCRGKWRPDRRHRGARRSRPPSCSTGCRSNVERLMTFSTSLVAVWYSSDS